MGLSVQKEALGFCDKLYIEKDSGGNQDRPKLDKALKLAKNYAKQGVKTNFVVYKLDRLTRKMLHLSAIIEDLTNHGIRLQSIYENIETDSYRHILKWRPEPSGGRLEIQNAIFALQRQTGYTLEELAQELGVK